MNPLQGKKQYAIATAEIQNCIEQTQIQLAIARKNVLALVEHQQEKTQPFESSQNTDESTVFCDGLSLESSPPCVQTHSQLSKLIALIAQNAGVSLTEPGTTPTEARNSAIKIFNEVTQLYKHLAEPMLQTSASTSATDDRYPKT